MSEIMDQSFGPKFDEIRARYTQTSDERDEYEREVRRVMFIRKLLMAIDAQRESLGMSKADLARRIGTNPSIVRRMFSSETANPTLKTVADMLTVLNIDVELKAAKPPASTTKRRSRKKVAA